MSEVGQWTVAELALESAREYDNPLWDVEVRVVLTAPSGRERTVDAFWDGGRAWRARFSPDEPGDWRWRSSCSEPDDRGLEGRQGTVRCVPYGGDNPLYLRGRLRLSDDRRSFAHVDGTPFFWLGDTAWNGVLRARPADWGRYLRTRREQGYTVIQFVSTHWRGLSADPLGETAYGGDERIALNPAFFRRLDPRVRAINEHGLVAAPVMLWAIRDGGPGWSLPEDDAARLARYLAARWGAYQVVWLLAGDGDYRGERAERWRRIGRAVFGEESTGRDRLATMHPGGRHWVGEEFRGEPWFDFVGYQSGHGSAPDHLRWLVDGPPAHGWRSEPPLPLVNLEPNYEAHPSYHDRRHFTDVEVRRAAYWSLLVSPTAGVTYGHNSIWVWPEEPQLAEGHERLGTVQPWHHGLDAPGARSMAALRRFFDGLPWWRLRPAPALLAEQPGEQEPHRHVAAAATDDGALAVVYSPQEPAVTLRLDQLAPNLAARWFDPRTGQPTAPSPVGNEATQRFETPGEGDWLLVLEAVPTAADTQP